MTDHDTPTDPASGAELEPHESLAGELVHAETRRARLLEAVTWPARRAGWAVQRHVLWPAGDALRRLADVAMWPFERVAWIFRSRVAWPVEDELSLHSRGVHAMLVTGSAAVVAVAVAGGILISSSPSSTEAARPTPVLASSNPVSLPDLAPPSSLGRSKVVASPVLHGVKPNFKLLAKSDNPGKPAGSPDSSPAGTSTSEGGSTTPVDTPPGTTADNLAKDSVPSPGKVKPALDVSRQFADAFVKYEIGKSDAGVRQVFDKTAADTLVRALKQRPPRLPKGVKVPKAKVLNVVPGPKHGSSLAVSVALVRLGASSELRLQLRHEEKTGWLVSDVRG